MNNLFNKPLEEMTDEELKDVFESVNSENSWVDEGWAMEPNPLGGNNEPSEEEIKRAHEKYHAIAEEMAKRSHTSHR